MTPPAPDARMRAVYVISVAAELAGVHPQTLRIYERKGLLEPARTEGGSRRYSEDDIELLRRIQDLTEQGLNLAGVQRVLELEAEIVRLRHELVEVQQAARIASSWPSMASTRLTPARLRPCSVRSWMRCRSSMSSSL